MDQRGGDQAGRPGRPVEVMTSQNMFHSISRVAVRQNYTKASVQRGWTHFNNMEVVERMNLDDTLPAKKMNSKTIDAAVQAVLSAELTSAVIGDSTAFKSGEFSKEHVPLCPPNQQWIVLKRA